MAKPEPKKQLDEIVEIVTQHPEGASLRVIAERFGPRAARRTIQKWLKDLVEQGRLVLDGEKKGARYFAVKKNGAGILPERTLQISSAAQEVQQMISRPEGDRRPVSYNRQFLDSYQPNESFYLSKAQRISLRNIGTVESGAQPAGTYARKILSRLLIDLSWNSSRLEGNTYSVLDTKNLIELGQAAEGKDQTETQMIMNHKGAIEFMVDSADSIGFNRYTIQNLHSFLAENLLSNPDAAGRLRRIEVGISHSVYLPLAIPQLIEECFDQVLATAQRIEDPFEQSFFVMVHLPYLQPFDDVNKRVSRLAANIPFVKNNLIPLAFKGVPRDIYTQALLGVYELNRVELLRDVFVEAYERSAQQYAVVLQSLGEPDPFRFKYAKAIKEIVGDVVRQVVKREDTHKFVLSRPQIVMVDKREQEQFIRLVETEIYSLHEGNFARYRVTPSEFSKWNDNWNPSPPDRT
ncbi:MAG: Fic family protein [Cyanobacteria bacterium REEB67]|nr:Fic family protein [Cyanobacteria bacterium REEB67]